jgi:Uma2 family endonuclease
MDEPGAPAKDAFFFAGTSGCSAAGEGISSMLYTAEYLFVFIKQPDDGSKLELARGEIVVVPALNLLQNACRKKLWTALQQYVSMHRGDIFNQAAVVSARNPDTVRFPDLIYFRAVPLPSADLPPELVVEMILPTTTYSAVLEKVHEYLAIGVRLIWIVDPVARIWTVYRGPIKTTSILDETDTLSGEDVLPGFSCRVADLFA